MAPESPFTIAIIGSGIGGMALAIGLLKQNVSYIILESAPRFDAIGAGIGLGPNALRAMQLMDRKFAQMYDDIKVGNTSPARLHEQFEILAAGEGFGTLEGWRGGSVGHPRFTRSSAHRKALLEVMQSLLPESVLRFNKRVTEMHQQPGSRVRVDFSDGESIEVDAVVGCDGIKGMSRRAVLEARYPDEVAAKYAHVYVYRGIAPMEEAKEIIGSYAEDAKWFMQKGRGCAMYPITKGQELNMVAFIRDENSWEGVQSVTEVSKAEMDSEFDAFDHRLKKLLTSYAKPSKWPLFHHPDTPTYYNGRICLLGDSAHACSPSQAAGAGQGLEDALILSKVLGLVQNASQLESAFQVYDSIRRPRAQAVVRESLSVGEAYFLVDPHFGHDMQKITDDANKRLPLIWWHDLDADIKAAEAAFKALTESAPSAHVASGKIAEAAVAPSRGVPVIGKMAILYVVVWPLLWAKSGNSFWGSGGVVGKGVLLTAAWAWIGGRMRSWWLFAARKSRELWLHI